MKRMVGWMVVGAALAFAGGCGDGDELREATERRRAEQTAAGDTARMDPAAEPAAPGEPQPGVPAFVLTDPPEAEPATAPVEVEGEAPAAEPRPAPQGEGWTIGRREVDRSTAGVATVRDVRVGVNDGFDRMVIEFAGGAVPGYLVEYVDRPIRQCGSGDPVEVAGDAWLRVRLRPSRGHDDRGRATVSERNRTLRMPVMRQMRFVCDFEADVEIVIGVGTPNRFRVFEQTDPARLVVDVAQ